MEHTSQSEDRLLRATEAFQFLPSSVRSYEAALDLHVSPDDGMLVGSNDRHYLFVGATALNAILAALSLARRPTPERLLDFGAGAGRVLRWLRAAFPDTAIDACDLREQDVRFCATQFAARTWQSGTDIGSLTAEGGYDLVWAGSVLTHLPPAACARLMDKLFSWCAPDGLLVFTTAGRAPEGRAEGERHYHPEWDAIRRRHAVDGVGYADYAGSPGYGLSIAKPSWYVELIEANRDARLVMLAEAAWDDHQDVWAIQNRPVDTMLDPARKQSRSVGGRSTFQTALERRETAPGGGLGAKLARLVRPNKP